MNHEKKELALTFLHMNPAAAASVLEQQKSSHVVDFLQDLSPVESSIILNYFLPQFAAKILPHFESQFTVNVLSAMEPSKIASILKHISAHNRTAILKDLPLKLRRKCKLLLIYDNDSAGAWMIHNIPTLPVDLDAASAIKILNNLTNKHHVHYVYIVNQQNHLCGKIAIAELLSLNNNKLIATILQDCENSIHSYDDLEKVEENEGWNFEDILPVINADNELVGALRHSDLRKWAGKVSGENLKLSAHDHENLFSNILYCYSKVLITLYEIINNIFSKKHS